jgi:hypothetical protein
VEGKIHHGSSVVKGQDFRVHAGIQWAALRRRLNHGEMSRAGRVHVPGGSSCLQSHPPARQSRIFDWLLHASELDGVADVVEDLKRASNRRKSRRMIVNEYFWKKTEL